MFADLYRRRELVWILVQRNLKIRYKHSALGFLWSLLTPLLMILMYAVFASILKFNTGSPDYLPFLVVGIVVWQFTAGCLNDSLSSIAGSANLVKKVAFPRVILPVSTVLANAVNFVLTFVVLLAYLLATGVADFGAAQWLLAGFAMQLALGTGGTYVRSAPGDTGLERVFNESIANLKRSEQENRTAKIYEERFVWPIAAALLLLAWEALLGDRRKANGKESA